MANQATIRFTSDGSVDAPGFTATIGTPGGTVVSTTPAPLVAIQDRPGAVTGNISIIEIYSIGHASICARPCLYTYLDTLICARLCICL